MEIEWLVADESSVGSPNRAECDIFGDDFGHFLANSGHFYGLGATL